MNGIDVNKGDNSKLRGITTEQANLLSFIKKSKIILVTLRLRKKTIVVITVSETIHEVLKPKDCSKHLSRLCNNKS